MLFGISGKKNSGKDTVAKIIDFIWNKDLGNIDIAHVYKYVSLESYIYSTFENKKFANKLKDIVCLILDCARDDLENREFKEKELGEEWRYYYYSHYRVQTDFNPTGRISSILSSKEEAEKYYESRKNNNDLIRDSGLESKVHTPRTLLQLIGTECGRDIIHPNIWINSVFNKFNPETINYIRGKAERSKDNPDYYVIPEGYGEHSGNIISCEDFEIRISDKLEYPNWIITDLRFPDETERIIKEGGVNIRVDRPSIQRDESVVEHSSETALDNYNGFQHRIINDGSLEDLIRNVIPIVRHYKKK